jgi:hypothetical protein
MYVTYDTMRILVRFPRVTNLVLCNSNITVLKPQYSGNLGSLQSGFWLCREYLRCVSRHFAAAYSPQQSQTPM